MDYVQNTPEDVRRMLATIGVDSVDRLFDDVPAALQLPRPLNLPAATTEMETLRGMAALAGRNASAETHRVFVGAGSYDHFIPPVVEQLASRGEFYTAYTPYQAEASQGTLQATFEYQSMICALTGMDVSNASHYDGATALAEAILLAIETSGRKRVLVGSTVHPVYRRVVGTYLANLGASIEEIPHAGGRADLAWLRANLRDDVAAVAVANPNFLGILEPAAEIDRLAREKGAAAIACVNPLSLGLLQPPGSAGFDIAVGDGQPLGNDMSYGGPAVGIFAAREEWLRKIPGRLVGQATDHHGRRCFVLTLQTREQHIRREKALSNICTNQALIALRAAIYLAALGRHGIREVAELCVDRAHQLAEKLRAIPGVTLPFDAPFFHEFVVSLPAPPADLNRRLLGRGFVGGYDLTTDHPRIRNGWLLCATEKRTPEDLDDFAAAVRQELAR